jgi:YihY family inner membrane protein
VGVSGRLKKFSVAVRQTVLPGDGEMGRGERFLATSVRFLVQMSRQFAHDRCPRQAASLSFQTMLAFVPLGAVLLALTRWAEHLGDTPTLTRLLEQLVLPVAAQDLAERISGLVGQVDFETMGWVGGITFALFGGTLLLQIEDVLNDVWNVGRARRLWQRAAAMLGFVILALPALAAAFYLSFERLRAPADWLVPSALLVVALTVMYKLLPHIRVHWRSAIAGALVASALLAVGHWLYGEYVERFRWTYESIYGAVAFLPITLLWVYLGWLFFLLGAEVAYTSQNLSVLWLRARRIRELQLGIHIDSASLILSRLVLAGVLHRDPEGRLSLGRDPATIALVEVYDAVVDRRPLDPDLDGITARHRDALRGLTLADAPPGPQPGGEAAPT